MSFHRWQPHLPAWGAGAAVYLVATSELLHADAHLAVTLASPKAVTGADPSRPVRG